MTKYHSHRTTVYGQTFDSKKEAGRYLELLDKQKRGEIRNLRLQVPFVLAPSVIINGRKKPELRYFADFVYEKNGKQIVEDCKSAITRNDKVYRIKKHLMKSVHGIEIFET